MTSLYDPYEKVLQQDILRPAVPAYINKGGKGQPQILCHVPLLEDKWSKRNPFSSNCLLQSILAVSTPNSMSFSLHVLVAIQLSYLELGLKRWVTFGLRPSSSANIFLICWSHCYMGVTFSFQKFFYCKNDLALCILQNISAHESCSLDINKSIPSLQIYV